VTDWLTYVQNILQLSFVGPLSVVGRRPTMPTPLSGPVPVSFSERIGLLCVSHLDVDSATWTTWHVPRVVSMPYRSRRELSERVRRIDNPRSLLRDAFIVRAVCAPTAVGHANMRANSERCWVGPLAGCISVSGHSLCDGGPSVWNCRRVRLLSHDKTTPIVARIVCVNPRLGSRQAPVVQFPKRLKTTPLNIQTNGRQPG